ncbi:MAG: menaquinone biosynthesis decarboxylase, partial [Candidatus Nitrosothermus koennekii]
MSFENLREYIDALEASNQLKKVNAKVSVDLEMAEILRRLVYNHGPAVLFENVENYDMKVLGNAFGSMERMKIALQMDRFEEIGERITALTRMDIPSSMFDKLKMLPKLSEMTESAPKIVNKGPVMENISKEPNLLRLPALKSWPKDAGRFITFGLVVSKHPTTGVRNLGVYRIQLIDENKAIMHWQIHKRGAQHYLMKKEKNEKIEVAIIIGADPATIFSAVAPVPEGL